MILISLTNSFILCSFWRKTSFSSQICTFTVKLLVAKILVCLPFFGFCFFFFLFIWSSINIRVSSRHHFASLKNLQKVCWVFMSQILILSSYSPPSHYVFVSCTCSNYLQKKENSVFVPQESCYRCVLHSFLFTFGKLKQYFKYPEYKFCLLLLLQSLKEKQETVLFP